MKHFTIEERPVIEEALSIMEKKLRQDPVIQCDLFRLKCFLHLQMARCEREHLGVFYLDNRLRLLDYRVVFSGTINYCEVSPREIAKDALELNAIAIVMAHNHPSGCSKPSVADIAITKKIKHALELFEIKLIEHFIIGKENISALVDLKLI